MKHQRELLRRLLRFSAGTLWGRINRYDRLSVADDVVGAFQDQIPLQNYEALQPFILRHRRGEPGILWPGQVRSFAVSSGTASSGRVLPVTNQMLRTMGRCSVGVGLRFVYSQRRPKVLSGKLLTLPGRVEADSEYPGNLVGEMSALVSNHAPWLVRRFYQSIPNTFLIHAHWEEKLTYVAEHTIDQDVRAIAMVPSWTARLIECVFEACRKRGRSVRSLREVWPNLRVLFSGGVALSSYRSYLEAVLPGVDLIDVYSASEGFFAFQTNSSETDLQLHLNSGVFYEFVKVSELKDQAPRRRTLADVELDTRYAMYVSTCSGLWAYPVRDVIRFTSTDPPRIVVAGRTAEMLDLYGEALFGEEVRLALQHACSEMRTLVLEYHVAPRESRVDVPPGHQWIIEVESDPPDLEELVRLIDSRLCDVNRHYGTRRRGGALTAPEVVAVAPGTLYSCLKETKGRIGAQTKVPRMGDERTLADAVMRRVAQTA